MTDGSLAYLFQQHTDKTTALRNSPRAPNAIEAINLPPPLKYLISNNYKEWAFLPSMILASMSLSGVKSARGGFRAKIN